MQSFRVGSALAVVLIVAMCVNACFAASATAPEAEREDLTIAPAFRDCAECPELVALHGGAFEMGSPDDEAGRRRDEGPRRTVRLHAFAVGRFEVTEAQWAACVKARACTVLEPMSGGSDRPIAGVSWTETKTYLKWLSDQTGFRYRLPSETEWEYAARAGGADTFATGSTVTPDQATYRWRSAYGAAPRRLVNPVSAASVGSHAANRFGLFDTQGNLWEWVEDCYVDSYRQAPMNNDARRDTRCFTRAMRGGAWNSPPEDLRSASRQWQNRNYRSDSVGFRVARDIVVPPR